MSIKGRCILKDKFSEKIEKLLSLIKANRKVQIGLAILFALILVVCYFAFLHSPSKSSDDQQQAVAQTSAEQYVSSLEDKLESLLSTVKGAGDVTVVVTLESGFEYIYATEEIIKETSSGTQTTTSIILVDGEPVVTQELFPKIKGVLVTATGADDFSVKVDLITAIQTAVEVANENITILTRS